MVAAVYISKQVISKMGGPRTFLNKNSFRVASKPIWVDEYKNVHA